MMILDIQHPRARGGYYRITVFKYLPAMYLYSVWYRHELEMQTPETFRTIASATSAALQWIESQDREEADLADAVTLLHHASSVKPAQSDTEDADDVLDFVLVDDEVLAGVMTDDATL
jgi:hypothetical protein